MVLNLSDSYFHNNMFKFNVFWCVFVQNWLLLCVLSTYVVLSLSVSSPSMCKSLCTAWRPEKNLKRFASTDFFVQKIVADSIPNAFPGIGLPGRSCRIGCTTLQSSHTADTNRSAVSMLICCIFVSICTHDLNNLSAFSCFFYSYVFMRSLPEAPGMKFSLEFFVVNSLCRTFHRIYILIFLFCQSCQPCEVHNIQVQCRRSCTSTIGKKKIEFCSTSEFFIVECLAFPTSLIRCCFWGHIIQMLSP